MIGTLMEASNRGLEALLGALRPDGSFGPEAADLACHFKAPALFGASGRLAEAHRVLDHAKSAFLRPDGDFGTSPEIKSGNPAYLEYLAYTDGWLAMAAQRLGRFDVAMPAWEHLLRFYHPGLGGFTTRAPFGQEDDGVDVLTTAHLGLASLYFGDLEKARRCGDLLRRFLEARPDPGRELLLRMDGDGSLVTTFPEEAAVFHRVRRGEPFQAFFMVGYPAAFLARLAGATPHSQALDTARRYLDFALGCEGVDSFHFGHKVGWAAATMARLTGDPRYRDLAERIGRFLVGIQGDEGWWLGEEGPLSSYDQTAEIALWLREMAAELRAAG